MKSKNQKDQLKDSNSQNSREAENRIEKMLLKVQIKMKKTKKMKDNKYLMQTLMN